MESGNGGSSTIANLTQKEIEALIQSSGDSSVEVFTKLTAKPGAGRQLSAALEKNLADAAQQGQVYTGRIPKLLFKRLMLDRYIRTATTEMGGVRGTEIIFEAEAMKILFPFFK